MKRIVIILISISLYATVSAQGQDPVNLDSVLLVQKSRLQYCLAKVEQVNILSERVMVKDQQLQLADKLIADKNKELGIWEEQYHSAATQRDINQQKFNIETTLKTDAEKKTTSLRKQNTGLKVAVGILLAGIIYQAANK